MVIGSTHVVQVNGLRNGTFSFFPPWCLWHMHTQEVLSMLRTFHPNINRPIHTWKTFQLPHHFISISFWASIFVSVFLCFYVSLSAFLSLPLCFYLSFSFILCLFVSIFASLCVSIFSFSLFLCLLLPFFMNLFIYLHLSLYLFVSLYTSFNLSIFFPSLSLCTCTTTFIQICVYICTYKCGHICIHVQHSCIYTYFYKICVDIFSL